MSYQNFKPIIWSKYIQREVERKSQLADWCNKKFEGEAKLGEKVKIIGVGAATIKDYVPGIKLGAPETVPDSALYLEIDQAKAFNFGMDDIDKQQAKEGVMQAILKNTTDAMAVLRDKYVGSMAKNAEYIPASATKITSGSTAKGAIDEAILQLRENDIISTMDVVIEVPWFVYNKFRDNLVELKTNNDKLLEKGIIAMYDGCYVRPSNNLLIENDTYYGMVRTHDAIAFASGINKTKAYEPEEQFEEAIKGLNTYGAKIVRPKELVAMKFTK